MKQAEEKLKKYMDDNKIEAEHLIFDEICHSVDEAAKAANATPQDFVKSICLKDKEGNVIVAIVKGEDRVDNAKVGKLLGIETPKTISPAEIYEKIGYVCGGVPAFGYAATFLVDERVLEREAVYTGGGSEYSLVKIAPKEMIRANSGRIVEIRK